MSLSQGLVAELAQCHKFFRTTISVFEPADAGHRPDPKLYTVAGHIAHVADSVDWFIEGAFGSGWDMDFDKLIAKAHAVESLDQATAWLTRSFDQAMAVVAEASDQTLLEPIADKRIMDGAPRLAVVSGITDHTAHHRGALTVYARLIHKISPMPYG